MATNTGEQLLNISKFEEVNEMLRRYWHETGVWVTGCAGVSCILQNEEETIKFSSHIHNLSPHPIKEKRGKNSHTGSCNYFHYKQANRNSLALFKNSL